MSLDSFLQQILNFTGVINPTLIIVLCIACAVGEFAVGVPYLLETIWLLAGYHVGKGTLSPLDMAILWLAAQAGRQIGSTALFFVGRAGSAPVTRLQQKLSKTRFFKRFISQAPEPLKIASRINYLSPFSVALGRLFWLRIPLSITLGIKRKFKVLSIGVLVSSIIFDVIYLLLGLASTSTPVKPEHMALYAIIGVTSLYIITFSIQYLSRRKAMVSNSGIASDVAGGRINTGKGPSDLTKCNRRD